MEVPTTFQPIGNGVFRVFGARRSALTGRYLPHLEGEGEWCLPTECHVGEDDDE